MALDVTEENIERSFDEGEERSHTRVFFIRSEAEDDPFDIAMDGSLPQKYDVHPADIGCLCKTRNCIQTDAYTYTLTCNYDNKYVDPETNPLDRIPVTTFSSDDFEIPCDVDLDSVQVVDKAGSPFDPAVTRIENLRTLNVSINLDPSFAITSFNLEGTVNAATWSSFGSASARTVLCRDVTVGEIQTENDQDFRVANFTFVYRSTGWKKKVLNAGFFRKDGSDRKQILVEGSPASSPVLLNSSGAPLGPTGTPVWLEFRVIPDGDFSTLPF